MALVGYKCNIKATCVCGRSCAWPWLVISAIYKQSVCVVGHVHGPGWL